MDDIFHVLWRQWFKIKLVRNIKVGAYRFRVIIDNHRFITRFRKSPSGMYGTIIKFNALPDTDRARAKHQHLFRGARFHGFIFTAETGIIVRSRRFKFCSTGIHHLEYRCNAVLITHFPDFFFRPPSQPCDHRIGKFDAFRLLQKLNRKRLFLQGILHFHDHRQFVDEPVINLCNIMYFIIADALSQCLGNHIDSLVIHLLHPIQQFFHRQI